MYFEDQESGSDFRVFGQLIVKSMVCYWNSDGLGSELDLRLAGEKFV